MCRMRCSEQPWPLALVLFLLAAKAPEAEAEAGQKLRILSLMTVDTVSHHKFMAPLTVRLAELGHHVHSVDILMPESRPPTLNVTVMENAFQLMEKLGKARRENDNSWLFMLRTFWFIVNYSLAECKDDFQSGALKRLVEPSFNHTFHVILVDYIATDCMLGFSYRFGYPPVVAVSPFPSSFWVDMLMGNPPAPSLASLFILPFRMPMTFLQRLVTFVCSSLLHAHAYLHLEPAMDALLRDVFGPGVPTTQELKKHVAVALLNELPWWQHPRPLAQSMVQVGGMHVVPADLSRIPTDLKRWMDEAEDGFILMSFGSVMKSSDMDEVKRNAFLGAFAELKQRVIWKFEDDEGNITELLSPNVRVRKWLPQNDVLGHPNLRLFISHCGGLSSLEFMYHGVPVLGVPFMVDQFVNVQRIEGVGMGRRLLQEEITKDRFLAEIREMIDNPTYRESAQEQSRLLQDQMEPPLDRAVWWVEYVARHRGAPHLRSPALALRWYQVLQLDVLVVLVLVAVALLASLGLCCRCCLHRRHQPRTPSVKDKIIKAKYKVKDGVKGSVKQD